MDRKEAIRYLEEKEVLDEPVTERVFTPQEEHEIDKVMKRGRIYGDPLVILNE